MSHCNIWKCYCRHFRSSCCIQITKSCVAEAEAIIMYHNNIDCLHKRKSGHHNLSSHPPPPLLPSRPLWSSQCSNMSRNWTSSQHSVICLLHLHFRVKSLGLLVLTVTMTVLHLLSCKAQNPRWIQLSCGSNHLSQIILTRWHVTFFFLDACGAIVTDC